MILRHQHQGILQDQRQIMVALKMYLGTIIQLETVICLSTLLLQMFELTVTTRQPIGTIKVINTQRLVAEAVGRFNQIARMRCAVQKTEVGFTQATR